MKFSIRDLLLVTVIVALGVGWWVDRTRLVAECKSLGEFIDQREDWWLDKFEEYKRESADEWLDKSEKYKRELSVMPSPSNSSAPAPIPPKP